MVAVFLGKRLIDAGLVNARKQRLQRSNVANIGFQAVPHTVDQAAFFQHDRMSAALFLAGGTIIVVVLLAVCAVGLAGHAASAAPADQNTGEQVHRVLVGRSAGIQPLDALHQLKILTGDQRFMGIRDTHPLGGGTLLHLLDLVMRRTLFALHQRSGVGFVLQDADNGGSRPFAVGLVCVSLFRAGQAVVLLVCQRRENAQPVQLRCDLGGACALQPHTENVADNAGGVGIGDE